MYRVAVAEVMVLISVQKVALFSKTNLHGGGGNAVVMPQIIDAVQYARYVAEIMLGVPIFGHLSSAWNRKWGYPIHNGTAVVRT